MHSTLNQPMDANHHLAGMPTIIWRACGRLAASAGAPPKPFAASSWPCIAIAWKTNR
jgi:hypothetical protein